MSPALSEVAAVNGKTASERENRAFVLQEVGRFSFETRSIPKLPSPNHVLLRIIATGLRGSDIHYWTHGQIGPFVVRDPIVLGHESSAEVVEVGSAVTTLKTGDRVAVEPGVPCRTCDFCRGGKYNLCTLMQFAATPPHDGTLSTYYTVPEDFCFALPSHVSFEEGALVEPLSITVHAVKLGNVTAGQSVLVLGAGPIGLLCGAVAQALGASAVVLVDIVQSRLDLAEAYGATGMYRMTTAPPEQNATEIASKFNIRAGFDIVMEATGAVPCIGCGVHALKRGGVFVQVGLGPSDITFPVGEICSREATYKGSFRYGPGDYKTAVDLLASKKVSVKELITHTFAFDRAQEAFEGMLAR